MTEKLKKGNGVELKGDPRKKHVTTQSNQMFLRAVKQMLAVIQQDKEVVAQAFPLSQSVEGGLHRPLTNNTTHLHTQTVSAKLPVHSGSPALGL